MAHFKRTLTRYILTLTMSFFSLFTGCSKTTGINNKYVTATAPNDYADITDYAENDILFLDNPLKNGLESIFSIDNTPDLIIQSNAQTIRESTPKQVLTGRLNAIREDTRMPDFNWKNFTLTDPPRDIVFKGYKAAEATFMVDEDVNKTGKIIQKKIKRMVVFTEKELWNFVLSPSEIKKYDEEMQRFDKILESITIKR